MRESGLGTLQCKLGMRCLFGLSIERPILDHHAKAHIHEIREIRRISPWNLADFMKSVKSGGFHHEIRWISPWNPVDFMKSVKSGGFHHEMRWISGEIHPNLMKSDIWAETLLMFQQKLFWFYQIWVDFSKNLPDFMKSAGFHEIRRIWYGFHEIRRISCEIERPLQGIVTLCFPSCVLQ